MPEYQLYLCIVLLTRLAYLRRDDVAGWRFSLGLGLAQAVLLLLAFALEPSTFAMVPAVLVITVAGGALEVRLSPPVARILSLVLLVLMPALLQPFLGLPGLSSPALALAGGFARLLAAVAGSQPDALASALPIAVGLLLLANEVNIVMRSVFQALDLVPRSSAGYGGGDPERDLREYNAGRVIGILERWLMFLVVLLSDDWSALGFIIAAKSVVRFDQFRDRDFAEYMLVGTLMSALFATGAAWLLNSGTG